MGHPGLEVREEGHGSVSYGLRARIGGTGAALVQKGRRSTGSATEPLMRAGSARCSRTFASWGRPS
jgi:hypothetical protein